MDALSTRDTSRAHLTQQTAHQEGSSQVSTNFYPQSKSHPNSNHSSSPLITTTMDSAGSRIMAGVFGQKASTDSAERKLRPVDKPPPPSTPKPGSSLNRRAFGSIFNEKKGAMPLILTRTQSSPLPYPSNLTPDPSPLRPHCPARDRLRLWRPAVTRNTLDTQGRPTTLCQQDLELIEGVSLNSLQPATQAAYGSGLLAFHVFCDRKGISEDLRAPVDNLILKSFVATLAGIYSPTAITNYIAAVRAWHIVHGMEWDIGDPEMDAIIKGAKQMAPQASE